MYHCMLGYYGKLPLSAEFIRCQASGAEIDELDRWLREGMYHAKSNLGPSWSREFAQGDSWGFLYLPRQGRRFLIGLLKPSQDKAGREFPFLVYLLLDREEFHEVPWCAPMHFKEFFEQSHRLLSDVGAESDLARLQFRLQALAPVEGRETSSVETRYHAELLGRRMREHWADLFGEFENAEKYQVLQSLLVQRSGLNASSEHQWQAKLPLLPSSKEETYDLPFWIDVAYHASGHRLDVGILFWNRWPTNGKPVLFVSRECPPPHLLFYLIHPESWGKGQVEAGSMVEALSDAGRALLEEGDVTLEAFLHRVSCIRS
ncbi:MAG: type VI secretion system-associated protein TagF [Nitrospira defluvii]|nr:type VI secretion system-associated protein TagF [Nitrospira defluvii]